MAPVQFGLLRSLNETWLGVTPSRRDVSESYLVVSAIRVLFGGCGWARSPWETTESAAGYRITPVVAPEAGATLFGRPCRRQRTRRTLPVRPRRVLESWHCGWSRCVLHLPREVFESGPGELKETSVQLHVRRVRPVVAPATCASPPGAARGGRVAELAPELPRQCEKKGFRLCWHELAPSPPGESVSARNSSS